jgi:hypothetical protein
LLTLEDIVDSGVNENTKELIKNSLFDNLIEMAYNIPMEEKDYIRKSFNKL